MRYPRRVVVACGLTILAAPWQVLGQTLYAIGPVSAQEQFYIELINRARANPAAEGARLAALGTSDPDVASAYAFFNVDLARMRSEMSALPAAPPLVPNEKLRAAALRHSLDMAATGIQDHIGSDGSTIGQRAVQAGYNFNRVAENIFIASENTAYGHAGFEVDWGNGPGGMQPGRGHRVSIHDPLLREVGVGIVATNGPSAGPQVVTQVFGTINSSGPFVTGVAFLDLDRDQFYDPGEGISGVKVTVQGNSFRATTAVGGGYAIPLPGNGTYQLSFAAAGVSNVTRTITVAGGANVKADLRKLYAPRVTGPSGPVVGQASAYAIDPVAGATRYRLRAARLRSARRETAEDGQRRVAIEQSGSYQVVQSSAVDEGTKAFHLSHPVPAAQSVRLITTFVPSGGARLVFRSRLATATGGQAAVVEIVSGGERNEVFRQTGTGFPGEAAFRTVTVDLSAFANKEISLQFRYLAAAGQSFFPQTDNSTGWFFDGIELQGTRELFSDRALDAAPPTRTVQFSPDAAGLWWLRAQARVSGRFLRSGTGRIVRAISP